MKHYHPDPDHTPDGYREHDDPAEELQARPLWERDNVVLTSVGIDVGSAGTQVVFSRVQLRRQGIDLSTRYLVIARETLFESEVALTPYLGETLIDARGLGEIVDAAYFEARLHPDDIDTGVVILTGEALRRENAEPIARLLAEKCGDLVCASAGHHMEATLAAHGSGAVDLAHRRGLRILNLDVGGGTTKLAVVDHGRILATAAIHIGGRLAAFDSTHAITRLEAAGRLHARRAGYEWLIGGRVTDAVIEAVARAMADDLITALTRGDPGPAVAALFLTDPIELGALDGVICSGGVAEYVYRRETRGFGDLGRALGEALRECFDSGALPWPLLPDSHGIRSTVLGCAEFAAQLSGNTCYVSDVSALLPRRNLKVLRPDFDFAEGFHAEDLSAVVRRHLARFETEPTDPELALAFHWQGAPSYLRLRSFAGGIVLALAERIERRLPLYVVLDADIAMSLGSILHAELASGCDVLAIDGLELWDFDAIDIGRPRQPSRTMPVTIKSLVFRDVDDGVRRRELVRRAADVTTSQRRGAAAS
ncbi:MAG TPA: ethanolamine ammonia-lyase reactivating factor EutA [Gammaproteobacteria bacterium]|nr:ethanolamine ammonia-lyase reactivating factor EutA [Gammaproteobacteria bacterium]